jgi:hypothetical protein
LVLAPRGQAGKHDVDEPADRRRGRQVLGCGEGVQAVVGELLRRDIVPDIACLRSLGQKTAEKIEEPVTRVRDVLASMEERADPGVARPGRLADDRRVGLEDGLQSLLGVDRPVADLGKTIEMFCDLTLVPGEQDRIDLRKVLVEGRPPDTRLRSDPRHRHGTEPVLGNQGRRRVHDRVSHVAAVSLNRLVP